jgi:hypothetical protein
VATVMTFLSSLKGVDVATSGGATASEDGVTTNPSQEAQLFDLLLRYICLGLQTILRNDFVIQWLHSLDLRHLGPKRRPRARSSHVPSSGTAESLSGP